MRHISFPSIDQFRSVIKHVKDTAKFHNEPLPTLNFSGTVKLHGTNHAVCFSPLGIMYTQSRERVTTPEDDNAGSSTWSYANRPLFTQVLANIQTQHTLTAQDTVQIFGEFCGGNIQKSVGLNNLPKMFVVFAIRISENSDSQKFLSSQEVLDACGGVLLSIYQFPNYTIKVNFNIPELAQAGLIYQTNLVEQDCPVARQLLGADFAGELVGEGVVWTTVYKGNTLRFKVKGEKHSSSKVSTLAAVDVEKIASIREFVDKVVTEPRLLQGLEHVESRDPKNTGVFIKWVMSDIFKEESDTLAASGFTSKDVTSTAASAARKWFLGLQ